VLPNFVIGLYATIVTHYIGKKEAHPYKKDELLFYV